MEAVLQRAADNQVNTVIVVGIDALTSQQAVQMADKYESVFAAVGIHPNSEVIDIEGELKQIESWLDHPKVVAIGEIGLDYYWETVSPEEQKYRLSRQLRIASDLGLPIIVHNRNAMPDLYPLVAEWSKDRAGQSYASGKLLGVFHSFSEDHPWAEKLVDIGFLIGVSGVITFPNARKIKNVVRSISLTQLLLETDAPYLCPQPFRGKRNEPAYLVYVLREVASILSASEETVAETTTKNAQTLFGIG